MKRARWKGWFYEKKKRITIVSRVLESVWKDWGSPTRFVRERTDKGTKGAIKWIEITTNCGNVVFRNRLKKDCKWTKVARIMESSLLCTRINRSKINSSKRFISSINNNIDNLLQYLWSITMFEYSCIIMNCVHLYGLEILSSIHCYFETNFDLLFTIDEWFIFNWC